jgi:hypothetical protein
VSCCPALFTIIVPMFITLQVLGERHLILYRLPGTILARRSEFFEGLLACGSHSAQSKAGRVDSEPIVLPESLHHQEWDCLLEYIFFRQVET